MQTYRRKNTECKRDAGSVQRNCDLIGMDPFSSAVITLSTVIPSGVPEFIHWSHRADKLWKLSVSLLAAKQNLPLHLLSFNTFYRRLPQTCLLLCIFIYQFCQFFLLLSLIASLSLFIQLWKKKDKWLRLVGLYA